MPAPPRKNARLPTTNDVDISVFAIFGRFLRSYAKTDVTMMFSAIFRSRSTYYQLCTKLGAPEHVPNTSQRRPIGLGGHTTFGASVSPPVLIGPGGHTTLGVTLLRHAGNVFFWVGFGIGIEVGMT